MKLTKSGMNHFKASILPIALPLQLVSFIMAIRFTSAARMASSWKSKQLIKYNAVSTKMATIPASSGRCPTNRA